MSASTDLLNVIYSSDDNYAQHLGVSIYSLLNTNRKFKKICVYIIDNGIKDENKKKINQLVDEFHNSQLIYISFDCWKDKLHLNMEWNISLSSYARLFVGSMLPNEVERVLYLDCDMIICDSLISLWETDLSDKVMGAVQDSVENQTKAAVDLKPEQPYFNAGMLLINLAAWRRENTEESCLDFIDKHGGRVRHHDQGVLNGVLSGKVYFLPLSCNLMTIHYIFNRKQIISYYGENAQFWSDSEIKYAKSKPIILHYTPSFTTRPWVKGCCHPLAHLYWDNLVHTPWAGAKPQKNNTKWYVRLVEWRYRRLPFNVLKRS